MLASWGIGLACCLATAGRLLAGGSGLNVVVVVNQHSTNSVQLGNYYCERRQVPPQNLLRIHWPGSRVTWARSDFETVLRAPLNAMLSSRQLSNQVEYILLSMDIPYRVGDGGPVLTLGTNSTTSALHYGFKPDGCLVGCPPGLSSCTLAGGSASAYAGSEGIFRQTPPLSAASNSWLVMMLTASNLNSAKLLVDRAVAADFSFPTQKAYLLRVADLNTDPYRSARWINYEDAVFDNRVRDVSLLVRSNTYSPSVAGFQLGSQFGRQGFFLPPNLLAPGGLADNFTSAGGFIFESNGHHPGVLDYTGSGAVASYGTVIEPCGYLEKFPSPLNYFYQARGFSAAEGYYQSVTNPYQGLLVGEPLCAPFARPGTGAWSNLPDGAVLSGTTNLSVAFGAPDESRPVQQVDLFLDGKWLRTLTNLPPQQNNRVYVTLAGQTTNYLVPAGATLKSVATGLATTLNSTAFSNLTRVAAFPRGDRLLLQSQEVNRRGADTSLTVSNSTGTAKALTTFALASGTNFVDSIACGLRNYTVTNAATAGSFLELTVLKTNGEVVSLSVTNPPGNTNTPVLVQAFLDAVNTNAALLSPDGLVAEDFISYQIWLFPPVNGAEFNLRARSPGWPESQIRARLSGSAGFGIYPAGTNRLDEVAADLPPRAHLYVTAGATNLALTFPLNTATNADGHHELTAVAYEGSHVRTQTRVSRNIVIQNTSLAATFEVLLGGTNTALEATLQFAVAANTGSITNLELFSTGGLLTNAVNQASAVFSIAATNLGLGLHPFYAVVTRTDGRQYRTETKWIRIVGAEPPFALSVLDTTPTLAWPATAGRRYEVWSQTNVAEAFALRDAFTPTNSAGLWSETNAAPVQRVYRVRAVP